MGWGVCRALSIDREVLIRDFIPGLMVLRDLSSGWGVLGDHSLVLADPRDLSTGWRVLGDLSLDWGDLGDLSTGWGVLGDLSFDCWSRLFERGI